MSEAVVNRAVKPLRTAWWRRFFTSMVFPTPFGPTRTTLVASSTKAREKQLLDEGAVDVIGPGPVEVGGGFEGAETRSISAIASTAKKGEPKHPRKAVMNAFTHRGASALATRGKTICHSHDAPGRKGWTAVTPDDYYWNYEEEE